MNITGYKKPTDEEFKKCYKTLFDLCPRPREYGTDEYKAKVEQAWEKFFDEQKKNLSVDTLPGERWEQHPTLKTYMCSTCGRAVHHINNNGYDNIADNLIMLTETQHNLIHCNEMGEI